MTAGGTQTRRCISNLKFYSIKYSYQYVITPICMSSSFAAAGLGARILQIPDAWAGNATEVNGVCVMRDMVECTVCADQRRGGFLGVHGLVPNMDDEREGFLGGLGLVYGCVGWPGDGTDGTAIVHLQMIRIGRRMKVFELILSNRMGMSSLRMKRMNATEVEMMRLMMLSKRMRMTTLGLLLDFLLSNHGSIFYTLRRSA